MCLSSRHKVLILSAYCGHAYLGMVGGAYKEWEEAKATPQMTPLQCHSKK